MRADIYEDAIRSVTGSGYGTADVFRSGTLSNDWSGVRDGLRDILEHLSRDAKAVLPARLAISPVEAGMPDINRAVSALFADDATDAERGYLAACALASTLHEVLGELRSHSQNSV
jgi:hypothetical protein